MWRESGGRNVRSKRCFRPSSTRIVKEQVANRLEEQLVDGWEQPKEEEEDLGITDSHELKVLPDNEDEEKEEILLLTSVSKQLEKQNTQINKILQMLQSVVKQVKSAERQLKLVKQTQLQIKQV